MASYSASRRLLPLPLYNIPFTKILAVHVPLELQISNLGLMSFGYNLSNSSLNLDFALPISSDILIATKMLNDQLFILSIM